MKISDSTVLGSITGTEKIPTSPTGHITPNMLKAFGTLPFDLILFKLTQSGSNDPVYNEIYNPAGISTSVVRRSAGTYEITLGVAWTINNIMIGSFDNYNGAGVAAFEMIGARLSLVVAQKLIIETSSLAAGTLVDDILDDSGFYIIKFP